MKTSRRQYDEKFKMMAVNLSVAKGSIKTTAAELGIAAQLLTRWRQERLTPTGKVATQGAQLSGEQQEILRLKKELRQAELERDILKKAVSIAILLFAISITSTSDRSNR
ncbi:transposase [Dyadobacter sp. LJ53]|uniref:transposase n=1 Tax=Dyadobacter chenwenxiniae TaxID=2906456 RepID=UPI001F2C820B|nr:transposase [Dyadobacter chenwenxiniae]MCF0052086.1 transposase [Dyadobacter chenwenxiniae]